MITTNSYPNNITPAPDNEIEKNSLTKEDLEGGKIKDNKQTTPNVNGGTCNIIEL